jgi:uncharacterized membrane protein
MRFTPVLVFHICVGAMGLLAGAVAMSLRKGSRRHRVTGNVFVILMVSLGASGAYLGFMKHQILSAAMGVLAFYLVATAWLTARRHDGEVGNFDLGALMVPLAVGAVLVTYGLEAANGQTGPKDAYPAAAYFIFGSVALLFAAGDIRMFMRGGVSGAQRIARHLRRMCFALFIAAGSFLLGPSSRPLRLLSTLGLGQEIFPALLRPKVLLLLSVLPLILMVFWMFRIRFTNAYKRTSVPSSGDVYTLRT